MKAPFVEGSIRWLRVDGVRGLEVMDVQRVSRKWANHHETYTLCALSRVAGNGEAPWTYRGREHTMRRGGTQMMEPGEFHSNVHAAPVADFGVLMIEPRRFVELLGHATGYAGRPPALRSGQTFDPRVEAAVHAVLTQTRSANQEGTDDALLSLAEVLCEAQVFERAIRPPRGRPSRALAWQTRSLIRDRWAELVPVSEITAALGKPSSTLQHAFRAEFGMGLRQYRRRVRLERCRRMLRDEPGRIGDIAMLCGFEDASTFCHEFKDTYGVTPSEYRRGSL